MARTSKMSRVDESEIHRESQIVKVQTYTALLRRDEGWWIGWVEEIPGVNSQGKTRAELVKNLESALREAIELNREEALASAGTDYERAELTV